jgi:hypothetical protein
MHQTVLHFLLLAILCVGQLQGQQRQFPNTRNGIHVFYDQLPYQLSEAQLRFAATHYAGCQKMTLNLVRSLRAYNPGFIVLNYRLAFGTYDSIAAFVRGNDWINDWDSTGTHADWFLTDPASPDPAHRVRQLDWNWYVMDISGNLNGNKTNGWKEYWVRSVLRQLVETECDGIFADSFGIPWNLSHTPSWLTPPGDAAWIPHMEIFGRYAQQRLHTEPQRFYFIPNVGPWVTTRDTCDYAAFSDGVMVEFFGSWGPFDLFELEDWKLEMNRILDLERRGKILICQPISSDEWNVQERMYNLANYLLIKGEHTFYNLVFSENSFSRLIYFPECDVDLGAYTQELPADIDTFFDPSLHVFKRNYANGMVIVNPTWDPITVALDKPYYVIDTTALLLNPNVEIGEDGILHDSVHLVGVAAYVTLPGKGGAILLSTTPSAIGRQDNPVPVPSMRLLSSYPNPMRNGTTFSVDIAASTNRRESDCIRIYDRFGSTIRRIRIPAIASGRVQIAWDGKDDSGRDLPSGLYFAGITYRDVVTVTILR